MALPASIPGKKDIKILTSVSFSKPFSSITEGTFNTITILSKYFLIESKVSNSLWDNKVPVVLESLSLSSPSPDLLDIVNIATLLLAPSRFVLNSFIFSSVKFFPTSTPVPNSYPILFST